jgi:hypothetical protein
MNIEDLNNSSQQFSYTAHQVHQKYWWKNVKVNIPYNLFSFLKKTFFSIDVDYSNYYSRYNSYYCNR